MTRDKWLLLGFVGFVAAVIFAADTGAAGPVLRLAHSIPLGDKVCHAVFMGAVCWQANRAFASRPMFLAVPAVSRVTGLVLLLVALEEVSQVWIPGRTFSFGDLLADLVGISVAVAIGSIWPSRRGPGELPRDAAAS